MVEVVYPQIRLGVIQPEGVDAQIVVVPSAYLPDIPPSLGVEDVDLHAVPLEIVGLESATLSAHEQALLPHGPEVFRAPVHGGPYGDDHLDAHGVQLLHHGFGIRPVGLVKLPVPLDGPVEEVDDDLIQLDALLPVLPGHGEDLLLGAVAQLALPEPHQVLREHPRPAGDGGVIEQDIPGRTGGGDPVVHFPGGPGDPFVVIFPESHPAHRGIVPQKPVSQRGHGKGNGDLGIALSQLQHAPLHVHIFLLVLPHAENLLILAALKFDIQRIFAAACDSFPLPAHQLQTAALPGDGSVVSPAVFLENQPAVLKKRDHPRVVDHRLDPAVDNGCQLPCFHGSIVPGHIHALDGDLGRRRRRRLCQRPVLSRKFRRHGRPYPQGVLPPGFDTDPFPLVKKQKRAAILQKFHHATPFPY